MQGYDSVDEMAKTIAKQFSLPNWHLRLLYNLPPISRSYRPSIPSRGSRYLLLKEPAYACPCLDETFTAGGA